MKLAAFMLLGLLGTSSVYAAEFAAPPYVTIAVTSGMTADAPFYRAVVEDFRASPDGDGATYLVLEEIHLSGDSEPVPRLIWQQRFSLHDMGKEPIAALETLAFEPSLNCCDYEELAWDKKSLKFLLVVPQGKKFRCSISLETGVEITPVCKRI